VAENLVRTAFDLVVPLIIGSVVQNAVIPLLNPPRADRVIEHAPTLLVRHGRILTENLRRERRGPRDLRPPSDVAGWCRCETSAMPSSRRTGT
jgi:uncharacterized membrane protein YcaP (DUF421 family)